MKKYILLLLSAVLLLSEIMFQIEPKIGFLSYAVLIGGCLISLAKADSLNNSGKLIIIFMILPIIRIAGLFIEFDYLWNSLIVYYFLCFLVFYYLAKFDIKLEFKWKKWYFLVLGVIIALGLGVLIKILFEVESVSEIVFLLPVMVLSEEVLFRGMIQNLVNKTNGPFVSVVFTSIIYGIFSLGLGVPLALVMFFASLIMCLIYYYSKNILFTIVFSLIFQLVVFAL